MSLVVRKPVFRVSDLVRHKPGCTATEDGYRLEISDLGRRGIVLSQFICVAKTKALVRFAVTGFFFHNVKSWFSHDAAHMSFIMKKTA